MRWKDDARTHKGDEGINFVCVFLAKVPNDEKMMPVI